MARTHITSYDEAVDAYDNMLDEVDAFRGCIMPVRVGDWT